MCTVTWWRGAGTYELFFNRDERRTRPASLPPALQDGEGAPFLAPVDPEGGGTWIAANAHGLCLCLLNAYDIEPPAPPAHPRTRGAIVCALAGAASAADAAAGVGELRLADFKPFHLLAVDPGEAHLCTWDGRALHRRYDADALRPVTTSSVRTREALAHRAQAWADAGGAAADAAALEALHTRLHDADPPLGLCMDRPDSRTVSLTHVQVDAERVSLSVRLRTTGPGFADPVEVTLRRGGRDG